MMDLSFLTSPDTYITLLTLTFLEIVLGVDNIVFITITTNKLPEDKRHLGRKLGLAGAFCMRALFLCFASYLASLTDPLFVISIGSFTHAVSVHDIIMFAGGAYLIYKGISELKNTLNLTELRAEEQVKKEGEDTFHTMGLPQAITTIMVMDIVFSIDSVITAVGLADQVIIMIFAVMVAIILMMIFIDFIADFINRHVQVTILALCFITVIGVLLVLEGLTINSGIVILDMYAEKLMVYFAMIFSFVICLIQIDYDIKLEDFEKEKVQGALKEMEESEEERLH